MLKFFLSLFLSVGCFAATPVLVSIAPQKHLVERIGAEHVDVQLIVPADASPHTFEPSPQKMISAVNCKIWFRIGEEFERQLQNVFRAMIIVDQREGQDLLPLSCCCCHDIDARDSHIWLSPNMLQKQAKQIAAVLSEQDPEHASLFAKNLDVLVRELQELHGKISAMNLEGKIVLVGHPAFAYFCRDYGVTQLSVEISGKQPTPRQVGRLLSVAKSHEIRTVFTQPQYSDKGCRIVAKQLGAGLVQIDPYREDVLANLSEIAEAFCD